MPPVEELIERSQSPRDFDAAEATELIDSLTKPDVDGLNGSGQFVDNLLRDVVALREALDDAFVDRTELIDVALACFIAHLPMIALGPPGTAKSLVFRQMSKHLGLQQHPVSIEQLRTDILRMKHEAEARARTRATGAEPSAAPVVSASRPYFEYLVTRFTTPEELLGPADLHLMIECAVFYRETSGLLPEARVAFLDEIFKANSAILNALLSITQERLFYNAGRPVRVPLCMVFGASNEPPTEKELGALYDRFPVRVLCLPVEDSFSNLKNLLKKSWRHACDEALLPREEQQVRQLATVNHFRVLHKLLHVQYGGRSIGDEHDEFLRAYCDTFKSLKREFEISDRSFSKLYRVARALAMLRGNQRLQAEELQVFKYCFKDPEAAAPLADAVNDRIRRYRGVLAQP